METKLTPIDKVPLGNLPEVVDKQIEQVLSESGQQFKEIFEEINSLEYIERKKILRRRSERVNNALKDIGF